MPDKKISFKDGGPGSKIGNFLRSIGKEDILNVASVVTSFASGNIAGGIANIKNLIDGDKNITAEQKAQANKIIELEYADLADARDLQKIALQQDDLFSKRFIYYLAIGVFTFSATVVLLLFWIEIPDKNRDVVNFILGVIIGTGMTGIFNFFYGSSKGSKDSGAQLRKLLNSK